MKKNLSKDKYLEDTSNDFKYVSDEVHDHFLFCVLQRKVPLDSVKGY